MPRHPRDNTPYVPRPQLPNPRVGGDLIEWLRKTFPEKGIRVGQTEIEAHRYAAQVELAQKIIKMGLKDEDHDVSYED